MTQTNKLLIGVGAGLLIGALTVGFLMYDESDDENRPPIIVRGGSLIFESDEQGKPGKPWKEKVANKDWISDHNNGHWVSMFQVTFDGGSGACGSVYTPDLTVFYKPSDGSSDVVSFQVVRQPKNQGNNKKMETVVSGTGLKADNTSANPTLTHPGESTEIVRVDYKRGPSTISTCDKPAKVKIELMR